MNHACTDVVQSPPLTGGGDGLRAVPSNISFGWGDIVRLKDKDRRYCMVVGICPNPQKLRVGVMQTGTYQRRHYDIERLEHICEYPIAALRKIFISSYVPALIETANN
jgi:hypothetical protein